MIVDIANLPSIFKLKGHARVHSNERPLKVFIFEITQNDLSNQF